MKRLAICLLLIISYRSFSQKAIIDTSEFDKWPEVAVGSENLSPDGKFLSYLIRNQPIGKETQVLQSTDGSWKKELISKNAKFSADSKWAIYKNKDSLTLIKLGKEEEICIPHIKQFNTEIVNEKLYLIYLLDDKSLVIKNINDQTEKKFTDTRRYLLTNSKMLCIEKAEEQNNLSNHSLIILNLNNSIENTLQLGSSKITELLSNEAGTALVYVLDLTREKNASLSISWLDLASKKKKQIFNSADEPSNLRFDIAGQKLLFLTTNKLWVFTNKTNKLSYKDIITVKDKDSGWSINNGEAAFTKGGNGIFFRLKHYTKSTDSLSQKMTDPVIWKSSDQLIQLKPSLPPTDGYFESYLFFYNIAKDTIFRIEQQGESYASVDHERWNKYILVYNRPKRDWWWQRKQRGDIRLISLTTGKSIFPLEMVFSGAKMLELSPNEKYIIYYDQIERNFLSYDIETEKIKNITKPANTSWEYLTFANHPDPIFGQPRFFMGVAGWLKADTYVLIYDQYRDLWKIDPTGLQKPINITNHFGHNNNIEFYIKYNTEGIYIGEEFGKATGDQDTLIAQGVNQTTKETGFYQIELHQTKDPQLLFKGPFRDGSALTLKKAKNVNIWLSGHASTNDAPNIFMHESWGNPKRISDLQPQKNYNWHTSELVTWMLPNGENCQGILYTPENLDTTKKHPIIFLYYEQMTPAAFAFYIPEWMANGFIDIPYYTSHGYLVFLPDIHDIIGHPGESALASIESAAQILKKRKYIDPTRVALAGHSWGAYETNYIVSHSHLFAAALETAGPSDFVSGYGSMLGENREPDYWLYETHQSRIGKTLWQAPNLYLENSPVFRADSVTTPLLMMHNPEDQSVPFEQGIEWFNALRRLGKPVWMLQYQGEGHNLIKLAHKKDFTIKTMQFFDHFLMGKDMPDWMKE